MKGVEAEGLLGGVYSEIHLRRFTCEFEQAPIGDRVSRFPTELLRPIAHPFGNAVVSR